MKLQWSFVYRQLPYFHHYVHARRWGSIPTRTPVVCALSVHSFIILLKNGHLARFLEFLWIPIACRGEQRHALCHCRLLRADWATVQGRYAEVVQLGPCGHVLSGYSWTSEKKTFWQLLIHWVTHQLHSTRT